MSKYLLIRLKEDGSLPLTEIWETGMVNGKLQVVDYKIYKDKRYVSELTHDDYMLALDSLYEQKMSQLEHFKNYSGTKAYVRNLLKTAHKFEKVFKEVK